MFCLHVSPRIVSALAVIAAVTLLQGCSGSIPATFPGPSLPLSQRTAFGIRASGAPATIYIADALNSAVDEFDPNGKFIGSITSGVQNPSGLLVDGNQNLWVSNSTTISMYPKGQSVPTRTLSDANGSPDDISVSRDGTVYVTNFFNGTVSVYAPGHNTPTKTLQVPNAQYVVGVAYDPDGNLYVTYNDATGVGYLDEFVGVKQSGLKRLAPRFSWAEDVKIDNAGNLLVLDGGDYRIAEFAKGGRRTGLSFFTFYQWNSFDISADGNDVAGTQALPDQDYGVLKTFPSNKPLARFWHTFGGGIAGVAIAPGHFP